MYGLPWGRGLTSAAAHQNKSRAVRKRMGEGWNPAGNANGNLARNTPRRPKQPYCEEVALANLGARLVKGERSQNDQSE